MKIYNMRFFFKHDLSFGKLLSSQDNLKKAIGKLRFMQDL